MQQQIELSVGRIHAISGEAIGAGLLVDGRYVLTCAHVIVAALGLSGDAPEAPKAEVSLDFPLIASGHILAARIIHWQPETDVAGLELDGDQPAGTEPVHLVKAYDLWGHSFRAFGFPAGHGDGVWASGVLRGQTAAGWVQIEDVKEPGYRVQPGFSGTPVWDEQLNGVIGMAIAADTDRVTKAAFVIPTDQLIKAWPELAERSIEAGSLENLEAQLAMFQVAQRNAPDPRRFQAKIDELQAVIAGWDNRVERQQSRIADGLEEQRQRLAEESARRRGRERLQVIGRPPLDVADYFKDRQQELATVGRLLAEPTTRLVSIIGRGGIGKTALACKVLQDLEHNRWPHTDEDVALDGIVYLSTRTAGISLERLFLDCAKLVGGEQERRLNAIWTNPQIGIEDKVSHLLEALTDGQYLLLLDNIEDLLDDRGQLLNEDLQVFVDRSLTTAHGARLLLTSRISLAFRREVMRFDRQVKLLEGLPVVEGVALLRELDPNGDRGLRDAPEEQLTEAVSLTHGVPRALEVLAGILANNPFATLDDVLERFYEQEDVVHTLIEENYKWLDSSARRVIEALAVFGRPVPPLAVDYILEPFAQGLDVPGIIQRLVRTSIVSVDRATKMVTLHPIDQDYAYSQLREHGTDEHAYTRRTLERRAADYCVQLRTPSETWKTIDDLKPQLAEFEHRARAGDYDEACRLLEPIDFNYMRLWGYHTRVVDMRERLLGHLTDLNLRTQNLSNLGAVCHALGQADRAIRLYKDALSLARSIGNRGEQRASLHRLGNAYLHQGQIEHAIQFYEEDLALAREIGDRRWESAALGNLGDAYFHLGRVRHYIESYEKCLNIAREIGDRRWEAAALDSMGVAYQALWQLGRAINLYEESLAIAHEISDRLRECLCLGNLGNVHSALGQFESAIGLQEQALSIAREVGHRLLESYQLLGLGKTLLSINKLPEARQYCARALDLDVTWTSYQAALALGIVYLRQRDPAAEETFKDAVCRCRTMLDKTAGLYAPRYALATALVGQAVCAPRWADESERAELLTPALEECWRALELTSAPGVIQDALRDLELIRMAGVDGLDPAFDLLESALPATLRSSLPL